VTPYIAEYAAIAIRRRLVMCLLLFCFIVSLRIFERVFGTKAHPEASVW
jgi:hypothetical protein